jgi:hypothetical protein
MKNSVVTKSSRWYEHCIGEPTAIIPNHGLGGPTRKDLAIAIIGLHSKPYRYLAITIEGMSAAVAVEVKAVERTAGEDRNDVFVIRGNIADAGVELPVRIVLNVETHCGTFEVLKKGTPRRSARRVSGGLMGDDA